MFQDFPNNYLLHPLPLLYILGALVLTSCWYKSVTKFILNDDNTLLYILSKIMCVTRIQQNKDEFYYRFVISAAQQLGETPRATQCTISAPLNCQMAIYRHLSLLLEIGSFLPSLDIKETCYWSLRICRGGFLCLIICSMLNQSAEGLCRSQQGLCSYY